MPMMLMLMMHLSFWALIQPNTMIMMMMSMMIAMMIMMEVDVVVVAAAVVSSSSSTSSSSSSCSERKVITYSTDIIPGSNHPLRPPLVSLVPGLRRR